MAMCRYVHMASQAPDTFKLGSHVVVSQLMSALGAKQGSTARAGSTCSLPLSHLSSCGYNFEIITREIMHMSVHMHACVRAFLIKSLPF